MQSSANYDIFANDDPSSLARLLAGVGDKGDVHVNTDKSVYVIEAANLFELGWWMSGACK
jgi:hypothetical protein